MLTGTELELSLAMIFLKQTCNLHDDKMVQFLSSFEFECQFFVGI